MGDRGAFGPAGGARPADSEVVFGQKARGIRGTRTVGDCLRSGVEALDPGGPGGCRPVAGFVVGGSLGGGNALVAPGGAQSHAEGLALPGERLVYPGLRLQGAPGARQRRGAANGGVAGLWN